MKITLNHPKGLAICFGTELWERFSYYGMRALLIYYLTQHFKFSDARSFAIYAAYTALVWALPVIGGMLADRYLGARKTVTLGAILLSAGHLLMTLEGPVGNDSALNAELYNFQQEIYLDTFFLALALIVTGVGCLKTNLSTLVGALYDIDDPRRDSGFTIFYFGINLGAAVSPILCGWLGQTYGWKYGFGLAGIGMLAGLVLFLWGQRYLDGHGDPPDKENLKRRTAILLSKEWQIYIAVAALVLLVWLILRHNELIGSVLGAFSAALGAGILYFSFYKCQPEERDRMIVVCVLIGFTVLFYSFYEQLGSSLNLFSDRLVDRTIFGNNIEASQLQSLPAIFVLALAPIYSILWTKLSASNRNPAIPVKFSIGLALIGIAFLMPSLGSHLSDPGGRIDLIWLAYTFFFMVCGELCMAPIALNMITKLCPKRVVGTMMGAYFMSLSLGSFFAGKLAKLTSNESSSSVIDIEAAKVAYASSYEVFGWVGLAAGVLLYLMSPLLIFRMHDKVSSVQTTIIERTYKNISRLAANLVSTK